jgi:ArsR family transcriptional regulator
MCVYDMAGLLSMNQSAISHQLRVLSQAGMVRRRKEGKTVFYSLSDHHVAQILNIGMTHVGES